jgi:PAS domain-containing protein
VEECEGLMEANRGLRKTIALQEGELRDAKRKVQELTELLEETEAHRRIAVGGWESCRQIAGDTDEILGLSHQAGEVLERIMEKNELMLEASEDVLLACRKAIVTKDGRIEEMEGLLKECHGYQMSELEQESERDLSAEEEEGKEDQDGEEDVEDDDGNEEVEEDEEVVDGEGGSSYSRCKQRVDRRMPQTWQPGSRHCLVLEFLYAQFLSVVRGFRLLQMSVKVAPLSSQNTAISG